MRFSIVAAAAFAVSALSTPLHAETVAGKNALAVHNSNVYLGSTDSRLALAEFPKAKKGTLILLQATVTGLGPGIGTRFLMYVNSQFASDSGRITCNAGAGSYCTFNFSGFYDVSHTPRGEPLVIELYGQHNAGSPIEYVDVMLTAQVVKK